MCPTNGQTVIRYLDIPPPSLSVHRSRHPRPARPGARSVARPTRLPPGSARDPGRERPGPVRPGENPQERTEVEPLEELARQVTAQRQSGHGGPPHDVPQPGPLRRQGAVYGLRHVDRPRLARLDEAVG